MIVRRKQLFSYNGSSKTVVCVLPVSAHIISPVRQLPKFKRLKFQNFIKGDQNNRSFLFVYGQKEKIIFVILERKFYAAASQ
jgi:hypothetical protein